MDITTTNIQADTYKSEQGYRPVDKNVSQSTSCDAPISPDNSNKCLQSTSCDAPISPDNSNPCFNTAAATSDQDYVQNVKLFLENVERHMFNSPEDYGNGISAIQRLVATQVHDFDGYNLTVSLVNQYGNGRLEHLPLPEFDGVKAQSKSGRLADFDNIDEADIGIRLTPEPVPKVH